MLETIPVKRRGGQPGNKNAKNNPGNKSARGSKGNRGGCGAPRFNRNACKPLLTLGDDLLKRFGGDPEVRQWIEENARTHAQIELPREDDFASSRYSPTVDSLSAVGREFRLGIFQTPDLETTEE